MTHQQTEQLYRLFLSTYKVSTDSRRIIDGSIFFALKGENFNGNFYAVDALNKGAACAVVDEMINNPGDRLIHVDNVTGALQQLANYHRRQLHIPVIAVTGSNGKTTTKELLKNVLSGKFKTLATEGNLNNHIGVPLTLLSIDDSYTAAVIEMGANHQKEIEQLCNIAEPTHGLITNTGRAHLEGFGGYEGVVKGKTELYDFLKKNRGTIFCSYDNELLKAKCENYGKVFYYGKNNNADVKGELSDEKKFLKVEWSATGEMKHTVNTQIAGRYNFENILAAIAVGVFFEIDAAKISKAIEGYAPSNQRSQLIQTGSTSIMLDAYNANPTSMEEAVLNFDKNFAAPKMVLLGDMFELGNESEAEHRRIAELLKTCHFAKVVFVGPNFAKHKNLINAQFFDNSIQAADWLRKQNIANTNILVKGSRGSKMELIMSALQDKNDDSLTA